MQNNNGLTPQEQELAAALGDLAPTRAGLSRDRVMFAAGQASIRRRNRIWQGISSGLVILLLVSIVSRPTPVTIELRGETVAHNAWRTAPETPAPIDEDRAQAFRQYVRTRRAVLDRGVEVLPASKPRRTVDGDPPLTRESLNDLLSST
jgi:hypothetical protein